MLVDEKPHELRDGDRRVRVVELDRGVPAERTHLPVLAQVPRDEVLERSGGEEELLAQAELLAGRRRVARVQHARDRLGAAAVGHRADMVSAVEGVELQRVGRPGRPQAQGVDVPPAPSDDRRVVGDRQHRLRGVPETLDGAVIGRLAKRTG
jgi:hypothetical protein